MSTTTDTDTGTDADTGSGTGAAVAGTPARRPGLTGNRLGAWQVLRRGAEISPELVRGVWLTLLLALVATCGRILVPIAVQQTIDSGISGDDGVRLGLVLRLVGVVAGAVLLTAVASYVSNVRLFQATEAGLATLRVKAFRHIHDLSVLTQNSERRGALVARVTSDVDTISTFVQWGGLLLVLSAGQLLIATIVMAVYSWQLTLLVWACFLPLFIIVRPIQRRVSVAYGTVRERVGEMLGSISEAVVGADTIRAYAVQTRTQRRIDTAIEAHQHSAVRAQMLVAVSFTGGVLMSGLVVAAVVVAGTALGVDGGLTLGELLAVLFLVQLFTTPVQMGTEVLNELQNAAAGWRRVIGVLDTPADIVDPGEEGVSLPRGPIAVEFEHVTFAYPEGEPVLRDVSLSIPPRARVAVVGETGSGKTTLAKLLTRLMDPADGRVLLDGEDLRRITFANLRSRVVMVPQEGFLFDLSLADNIAWGSESATREQVEGALRELGLLDWAQGLPRGLDTPVGQRGESLSAGERQLLALTRAYLADPDLLVLDEATSAVDPATEVKLQAALDGVTRGRTSVTIAHRLSTAEAADLVVVVAHGEVADVGHHADLLKRCEPYQRMYASWRSQTSQPAHG
ncbi:ABC transporter ATP-binding protein [Kineosporia sp. NBRC 101731]|uniref:ABC transporter ATP-binding protein n=1 Tax=Kineosporia sp. NBRC 101731 TaxID=3032199 RepID=UPI0024A229B6|nr:ABC transporter ATP-binding protein [Kineosporia sp. NBRC 101731]GLY30639.1 multidrug ABC transporter ATP-binding protein [Kineosporia sp. NBRC 101731]